MIGLDTNILVRYIVRDNLEQAKIASSYIREAYNNHTELFINNIVLCELIWVLDVAYKYEKNQIISTIEKILHTSGFIIENADAAWLALTAYKKSKADFANVLIGITNKLAGCNKTATFDKLAGKLPEFELIG